MAWAAKIQRLMVMEWSRLLQYRIDVLLWTATEAIIPLVALSIWYTISLNSTTGPDARTTLTYYILVIGIKIATDAWNGFFMSNEILKGDIVKYLSRPLPYFWQHIINNLVEKILKFAVLLPIIFIIIILLKTRLAPQIFIISQWPLFIISVLLASVIAFTISTMFGLFAFWLEDAQQLLAFKNLLEIVASGILIPFANMPAHISQVLSFLPFRYIISAPVEIILNDTNLHQSLTLIAIQLAWIAGVTSILIFMWRRGLKRYAVPGQ